MADFSAQLHGNTNIADVFEDACGKTVGERLNLRLTAEAVDRGLRLLYLELFCPKEYNEAMGQRDFAGLELMAATLDW